jgi:hypothetical protein
MNLDEVKQQKGPVVFCAKCGAKLGKTKPELFYRAVCAKCSPLGVQVIATSPLKKTNVAFLKIEPGEAQ